MNHFNSGKEEKHYLQEAYISVFFPQGGMAVQFKWSSLGFLNVLLATKSDIFRFLQYFSKVSETITANCVSEITL